MILDFGVTHTSLKTEFEQTRSKVGLIPDAQSDPRKTLAYVLCETVERCCVSTPEKKMQGWCRSKCYWHDRARFTCNMHGGHNHDSRHSTAHITHQHFEQT